MICSVWFDNIDFSWLAVGGLELPECNQHEAHRLVRVKTFEAESWDDAMRQYYEWQGWEPYKPMPPWAAP